MARVDLAEGAAPATPGAGVISIYAKSTDRVISAKDPDGNIHRLTYDGPKRNIIINGQFHFAQRQAAASLTTYSSTTGRAYGPDRFGLSNENASIQFARVDTSTSPPSDATSRYYGQFKKITNNGKFMVSQVVEGVNCQHLRGRTIRVQCRMRYAIAGSMTVRLGLIELKQAGTVDNLPATFISAWGAGGTDPTLGTNLGYIAPTVAYGGSVSGNAISCTLATTFALFSGTFVVPANSKNLIFAVWTNAQATANDELHIQDVAIYDGPELRTSFDAHSFTEELRECRRYYFKTFALDTLPAQGVGLNNGEHRFMAGKAGAAAEFGSFRYPVHMRIGEGGPAATWTFFNPAAANAQVRDITGAADTTATAQAANAGGDYFTISCTGAAGTAVGNELGVHFTVDAEL